MVAARRIFDSVVSQKMANEEGDTVEYRRSNRRGEGQLALPNDFHVGQLVNVIEGKASHQAKIEKIENEKATVRWLSWKGGAVAQVHQLRPIWDGLTRTRKKTDLFGSSPQLKPRGESSSSLLRKPKLPMRYYRKLPMFEGKPEITQEAKESKELLERVNPPPIDARGPSTAETERSPILSASYKALIFTAFNELYDVVQEYLRRQDCQVTTEHYLRRRKMKKAPFIQIKYTGVDILAMGAMMIEEEWRPDVIELFESARKVNKGREAVRKLVRHYIAKKHSREEAMKLF
jgi:hypothetical protein